MVQLLPPRSVSCKTRLDTKRRSQRYAINESNTPRPGLFLLDSSVTWQLYWHTMGGTPVGVCPGLLARNQGRGIGQALRGDQVLESRKPMIIVMGTVVGFTGGRGGVELVGKPGCPLFPGEISLFGEFHGERKCLCLPRLGKYRLALILGKPRQRLEALGFRNGIRRTQGNRPKDRDRWRRATRLALPTTPARRTAPSTGVADSRRENGR